MVGWTARLIALASLLALPAFAAPAGGGLVDADLCIYGGASAGVAAAVQASRLGLAAVLVEPTEHVGGLTTGGLGATDVGNSGAIGGVSREFYSRVCDHYLTTYGEDSAQLKACNSGFRFEPHVAQALFDAMLAEAGAPVYRGHALASVRMRGGRIHSITTTGGLVIRAKVFLDCTYEGDLMAAAGVTYTVGREPGSTYDERYNGVQLERPTHQFTTPTDPYRRRGEPDSGLLWSISDEDPGAQGEGDDRVQAYNLRMCLTNAPANRLPFTEPEGYDRTRYLLLARWLHTRGPVRGIEHLPFHNVPMPNAKTDTNNNGPFSTDFIGENYDWPEADYAERERIYLEHLRYQQGLMYFVTHDSAVPLAVRQDAAEWGLAADEFTDNGGWPRQLYVREGRRMVSDYVMTERNCLGAETVEDPVGMGAYNMDSHNTQRYARGGRVWNEGDVQIRLPGPYGISFRSIVPARGECENLVVPVAVSASHIAFGSIRMEPVFMVLGQSAATIAWLARESGCSVQDVDYARLRERLLADGQILEYAGPTSATSAAEIRPDSLPGIVLDDARATKKGVWVASLSASERRVGTGYIHDNDARGGAGIAYAPAVPEAGTYEVYLISPPHSNRATNALVRIEVDGALVAEVRVDQRKADANGFAPLGTFDLPAGARTTVTLSNEGADGYVVADGLQLLPVER